MLTSILLRLCITGITMRLAASAVLEKRYYDFIVMNGTVIGEPVSPLTPTTAALGPSGEALNAPSTPNPTTASQLPANDASTASPYPGTGAPQQTQHPSTSIPFHAAGTAPSSPLITPPPAKPAAKAASCTPYSPCNIMFQVSQSCDSSISKA